MRNRRDGNKDDSGERREKTNKTKYRTTSSASDRVKRIDNIVSCALPRLRQRRLRKNCLPRHPVE